jgi:hypothetical protein
MSSESHPTLADADLKDATQSPEPMPPQGTTLRGRVFLSADFPELQLFGLLMWKFGHPNGPMTFFLQAPHGDPDAPFKWDYLFVPHGNLRLQVVRASAGIELWYWGEAAEEADILAYLERNIARYTNEIADTIARLERHTLILNPYVRHRSIADFALEELNKLAPVQPSPPIGTVTKAELEEFVARQKEFGRLVERQASLTMLLVTESAFMAESYINLLLALLMRKEIKSSKAIMAETLMRKWRTKIERLHVDCVKIKEPASLGDARMGNAKRMFDIRNRVAHSYPDPEQMAVAEMWFYRSFPILETALPFLKFAIALHNQLPSPDEARFCKKAADDLVCFLIDLVDGDIHDQIRCAAESNPLGFNRSKMRYSVPFGSQVIMTTTVSPAINDQPKGDAN